MAEVVMRDLPCAAHAEFSKRLDDRWDEHLEGHDRERGELCKKIDQIFDLHRRLESRINWLLGGLAACVFGVQLAINLFKH
jgi:hypothetical protein